MAQAILFNQADNPLQTCANSYENRSVAIQLRLLGHVRNAGAALYLRSTLRTAENRDATVSGEIASAAVRAGLRRGQPLPADLLPPEPSSDDPTS